jgi:hypothetical protein
MCKIYLIVIINIFFNFNIWVDVLLFKFVKVSYE